MLHKDSTPLWLTDWLTGRTQVAEGGRGVCRRGAWYSSAREHTHNVCFISFNTWRTFSTHTRVLAHVCVCVCRAFVWLTVCLSRCLYLSFPFSISLSLCLSRSECVQAAHLHINSVKNYDWAIKQSAAPTWTHLLTVCIFPCVSVCVYECCLRVCVRWQSFWQAICVWSRMCLAGDFK